MTALYWSMVQEYIGFHLPDPAHDAKQGSSKYEELRDMCGAIDGTHIPIRVPIADAVMWRCRKGFISTNVIVSFNQSMLCTAIFPGAEGPCADADVLHKVAARRFGIPQGKFVLADAGYGLMTQVLTPYRGVRYHLKERTDQHAVRGKKPKNRYELFNLRHAVYRNVVERSIGVLKWQFAVLRHGFMCQKNDASRAIVVCAALYNFMRMQ